MNGKRGIGFWVLIIVGGVLNVWYLIGQTVSVFDYELTVAWGLQDPVSAVTPVGVAFGQGFGIGDTLVYIPIFVAGIIGLLKRKAVGLYLMFAAMAITMYWPVVCLGAVYKAKGAPGWALETYLEYSIVLPLIVLYGLWGMIYLFRRRTILIDQLM